MAATAVTPQSAGSGRNRYNVNLLRVPTILEQAVDVNDGQGGVKRVWQPVPGLDATIWVNDQLYRANYIDEGGELQVLNLHQVTMRYSPLVQSGARMRFNGQFGIWYIKTANDPDNQRHWLKCSCTEVAPT